MAALIFSCSNCYAGRAIGSRNTEPHVATCYSNPCMHYMRTSPFGCAHDGQECVLLQGLQELYGASDRAFVCLLQVSLLSNVSSRVTTAQLALNWL